MVKVHFIWYNADGTAVELVCWQTDVDESTPLPALARKQVG